MWLLRVGGRIQKSTVSAEMKHPVLLPRKSEIAVFLTQIISRRQKNADAKVA